MEQALEKNERYTYQQYILLEAQAEDMLYEYEADGNSLYGEIIAMAGGTKEHNILVQNISFLLRNHFRPRKCGVYTETVKLEVSAGKNITILTLWFPLLPMTCLITRQ